MDVTALGRYGSGMITNGKDHRVGIDRKGFSFLILQRYASVVDLAKRGFQIYGNLVGLKEITEIAGLTGCEIAYDLYLNGKKPVIVEMQDDLITTKGICLANTSYLRDFFKTNKVPVYLETSLCEIGDGNVTLKDKNGKEFTVDTDSVILSVGYDPAPVVSKGKNVHVIGDAAKVGNLRTVIWGAWNICMKL